MMSLNLILTVTTYSMIGIDFEIYINGSIINNKLQFKLLDIQYSRIHLMGRPHKEDNRLMRTNKQSP
jgi:hypothetical protein